MNFSNSFDLPKAVAEAMISSREDYDFKQDEDSISVTTLINPPYMRYLSMQYGDEIEIDVIDLYNTFIGTAIHNALEKGAGSNYIKEFRAEIVAMINDKRVRLSGKADLYDLDSKTIYDYKTAKVWAIMNFPGGKQDYIAQLNLLKYIYEENGLEVENLKLVHFLKDWSPSGDYKKKGYPDIPIVVEPVTIWSEEQLKIYLASRLRKHFVDEPDICTKEERWKRDEYKVMNMTGTRAVNHGTFSTYKEAEAFAKTVANSGIKTVEGKNTRCLYYCDMNMACPFYKNMMNQLPTNFK